MNAQKKTSGYLFALITILVWGTTFISSKVLLRSYTPQQVMLTRFILAYVFLWILRPRRLKLTRQEEFSFFLMGIFSCSLYFFTENTALTLTQAANVSIIVSIAPILTAFLAHFMTEEKLSRNMFLGSAVAFVGVVLVVFNGAFVLKLQPKGDLLALAAALCWAVYSVIMKRFSGKYDAILLTRRTIFWGMLTSVPLVLLDGSPYAFALWKDPVISLNFLYLGLIGSAACYVLWNKAFARIGIVATNNFIYINPFVTIVAAALILKESVSPVAVLGAVLITVGVIAAERLPSKSAVS
ncbi:MAG: DMT family transporter [Oscillibacter sp.]|jgi:drug/metabolite transporter (DMT)-like permease|nr:DMT family transporter [Oscillibacter sp.]